jgi:protein-tyrosine-phosphatase
LSFILQRWRAARRIAGLLRSLPGPARRVAVGRLLEPATARRRRLAAVIAAHPERLIIVCHGNIMRSAFAVAYLRQLAPERAARVVGAGSHATAGRAAQDSALRVAPEFGVSLASHAALPLASVTVGAGDVIVCMDRANEANVIARYGSYAERVFLVGDGVENAATDRVVVDPYARGDEATRVAFQQVVEHAQRWLAVIRV